MSICHVTEGVRGVRKMTLQGGHPGLQPEPAVEDGLVQELRVRGWFNGGSRIFTQLAQWP